MRSSLLILPIVAMVSLSCDAKPSSDTATARSDSAVADAVSRERQDSINRDSPGYVVDSILAPEEEIRRFRAAVGGDPVLALDDAPESRQILVDRFTTALSRSDSVALRSLVINPREFADLIYPESPYTRFPNRQSPALVWSQIQNAHATGYTRLLERVAGRTVSIDGLVCAKKPERQGNNTIWTGCTVQFAEGNEDPRTRQLFGAIVKRDGHFKFLSYSNDF